MRRPLLIACLFACAPPAGEVHVRFSFEADPPLDRQLFVSAWIEGNSERLESRGPVAFRGDTSLEFFAIPHGRPVVMRAQIADGPWRNSSVLFHAISEEFTLEPGDSLVIDVLFVPGPWDAREPSPSPPLVERVHLRRWPFGAHETDGAERYAVIGAEGAVPPGSTAVAFAGEDVATSAELGRATADASGAFSIELEREIARTVEHPFVARADEEDRLSDSSDAEGLQASRVEPIFSTLTIADADGAPRLGRASLVVPALMQPNVEWAGREQIAQVRSQDGTSLAIEPEPIWNRIPDGPGAPAGRYGTSLTYDRIRGRLLLFGGVAELVILPDFWTWDGARWTQPDVEIPRGRSLSPMAYDASRGRAVMFGGATGPVETFLNDTWEWDGERWEEKRVAYPPKRRAAHSLIYDPDRKRVVLFGGGNERENFNDLWEWDGTAWTEIMIEGDRPAPLALHAAAYDTRRRRMVLFGGRLLNGDLAPPNTWEWDGSRWTTVDTDNAPEPRDQHAMTYDEARGRVVMFGADRSGVDSSVWEYDGSSWMQHDAAGPAAMFRTALAYDPMSQETILVGGFDDAIHEESGATWSWNGERWTDRTPPRSPSPEGRRAAACAHDPQRGTTLLFGGAGVTGASSETWERRHGRWIALEPESVERSPGPRVHASAAYDTARQTMIMFGGQDLFDDGSDVVFGETWSWNGHWSQLSVSGPEPRIAAGIAYDSLRQRIVLHGGAADGSFRDLWVFDGTSWSEVPQPISGGLPDRAAFEMVYDSARDRVVMFGGLSDSDTLLGDTLEWDGEGDWEVRTSTSHPSGRCGDAMAYDPIRGRTVLFGGGRCINPPAGDDETWEWTGSVWIRRTPPQSPSPRIHHRMAFDASRQRVVLFGGIELENGEEEVDDTWEWDGNTWTAIPSEVRPPPRARHVMAYDEHRQRTVIFGGTDRTFGERQDIWEWDGETWFDMTPPVFAPEPRTQHAMAHRESETILFGGAIGGGIASDAWAWNGRAWRQLEDGPPARRGHAMLSDPEQRVVLFGGRDGDGLRGDTWIFDGSSWSEHTGEAPEPRWRSASAAELLFGGTGASGRLSDTWIWQESRWSRRDVDDGPAARDGHAMVFDPKRGRTVLFGGRGDQRLNDTWEWIGDRWIERHPPPPLPDPRDEHVLFYDRDLERVILFGGSESDLGDTILSDSWELLPSDEAAAVVSVPSVSGLRGIEVRAVPEAALSIWDAWEGRWRSSVPIERMTAYDGMIHLRLSTDAVDYLEITLEH